MDRSVVVDSRWRFGFPSIGGISTVAIADVYAAGEDVATIAHEYDLAPVEVLRALWFEGRHGQRPCWREWAHAAGTALGRGEVVEPPDPGAGGEVPVGVVRQGGTDYEPDPDDLTRAQLAETDPMLRALADSLDDWLHAHHGITSSHHNAGHFWTLLHERGYRIVPNEAMPDLADVMPAASD